MLCACPRFVAGVERPCRRCAPCRETIRSDFIGRCTAELVSYPVSTFGTLTFAPECYPRDRAEFMRFYRSVCRPEGLPFRCLFVAERGSKSGRLHIHFIAFGQDCVADPDGAHCFWLNRWGRGHVKVLPAERGSARYLAKYVFKSVLVREAEEFHPDGFGRLPRPYYPRRGGALGTAVVPLLAAQHVQSRDEFARLSISGDVNASVVLAGKAGRLPRAIKERLRAYLGVPSFCSERLEQAQVDAEVASLPEKVAARNHRRAVQAYRAERDERSAEHLRRVLDPGYAAAVAARDEAARNGSLPARRVRGRSGRYGTAVADSRTRTARAWRARGNLALGNPWHRSFTTFFGAERCPGLDAG